MYASKCAYLLLLIMLIGRLLLGFFLLLIVLVCECGEAAVQNNHNEIPLHTPPRHPHTNTHWNFCIHIPTHGKFTAVFL